MVTKRVVKNKIQSANPNMAKTLGKKARKNKHIQEAKSKRDKSESAVATSVGLSISLLTS